MNYVSIQNKAQVCVAMVAKDSKEMQKYLQNFTKQFNADPQNQIKGVLCLGELGKLTDLSKVGNMVEQVSALFKV